MWKKIKCWIKTGHINSKTGMPYIFPGNKYATEMHCQDCGATWYRPKNA